MAWGYNDKGQYGWIDDGTTPEGMGVTPELISAIQENQKSSAPAGSNPGADAAAQYAQQHAGYTPHGVMQEGQVTIQNGVPGVMVKYDTPNGSSTEWTPLPADYQGGPIDMNALSGGGGGAGGAGASGPSDPYTRQMMSLIKAQGTSDLSSTKAAIQKALIQFGFKPGNFNDQLGALDDTTKSLMAKNTESGISGYARLLDQKKDNMRSLVARLSSSGLRRSGAKGAQIKKGQLDWDRVFQDSLGQLMGNLGSMYSGYANNEYSRQMQLLQAMANASSQYAAPGGGGGGGGSGSGSGFTAFNKGTPLEGIDTGGYVYGSGKITDYGSQTPFKIGGGRTLGF